MNLTDYQRDIIAKGDEGSALLAAKTASTLTNCDLVDIIQEGMNGITVLRIPEDHYVAVHSVEGNHDILDLADHAASMVDRLVNTAQMSNFTPIAFGNVIDAREANKEELEVIADSLTERANHHGLSILNGELAVLGNRVNTQANIMGTMISIVHKSKFMDVQVPGLFSNGMVQFGVFDGSGKAIYINCDGVGTKTEFYERSGEHRLAINDFMAMNLDDAAKLGAIPQVISGVVETRGQIPYINIEWHAKQLAESMSLICALNHAIVEDRIMGYNQLVDSYNISGSVVSIIDEERLANPLKPEAGEYLIAIRGKPNPRSNGITSKREIMQLLGKEWCLRAEVDEWHRTPEGEMFLNYLAAPSTILYPVFKDLIDNKHATSVYHMSGGAFNGKLARPLAKHGLFVSIDNLFPPDYRELVLVGASFTSAEVAYAKWSMGNDGFVTTKNPQVAIDTIKKYGLDARVVGQLEKCGKTGVELQAFNGKIVCYTGQK